MTTGMATEEQAQVRSMRVRQSPNVTEILVLDAGRVGVASPLGATGEMTLQLAGAPGSTA